MKNEDIIGLKNPEPKSKPRMSIKDRAAQFASFAALSGYEEAVDETQKDFEESIRRAEISRWDEDQFC